jgi:hypothetical protein
MSKGRLNPARVSDMLEEKVFANGEKQRSLKGARDKFIIRLRKKGKKDPACLGLADKLENCRPKHRCKSPACPECTYAAQRLIAKVTRRFLKKHAGDGTIVCVTLAPQDGATKPGRLDKGEHDRRLRRWKERLGKAGVTWFVGATDWSFNEHAEGHYKPHWLEHVYGVTITKDAEKLKRRLRRRSSKTDAIPRPIKVVEWDGDNAALRYICKMNFWRRIATDVAKRFDRKTGHTRTCRATDKQPLRSKRNIEILLHLDKIGMQSRLILKWCQLINVAGNKPTIVLRLPKGQRGNR